MAMQEVTQGLDDGAASDVDGDVLEEPRAPIKLPPIPTTPEREQAIATVEQRPDAALRVTRLSGSAFSEGIETVVLDGAPVRVYSLAKTITDCFKLRSKVGLDVALEALREAWQQRKVTMDDLWRYAKVNRMTNVMRPYLEAMTG